MPRSIQPLLTVALIALLGLLADCTDSRQRDDDTPPAPAAPQRRATPPLSRAARLGRESTHAPLVAGSDTRFDPARAGLELRLSLLAPARVLPAQQLPIIVRVLDPQGALYAGASGWLRLKTTNEAELEETEVLLRRGVGSITTTVAASSDFAIRGDSSPDAEARAIHVSRPSVRRLSGTLAGDDLGWQRGSEIEISGDVTVPAGETLAIEAGCTVRVAPRANLIVLGDLELRGTQEAPVLFLPLEPDRPWGGLVHSGKAHYSYAILVGGGGDPSKRYGHSGSQAVIFAASGAEVELDHCAIQDSVGKGVGGRAAVVRIRDSLITRTDMGGELISSQVVIERSHFLDFPDMGAPFQDDDNDALYLNGAMRRDELALPSIIRDSVFIGGLDDAIDHNRAVVEIHGSWIHGFAHEGIAALGGGSVHLEDTAISGSEQAIEAGTGRPRVTADHVLLFANRIGARYGDAYGNRCRGTLQIRNSVILDNTTHALWNYLHSRRGPSPIGIELNHSLVDEASWDRGGNNIVGRARLTERLLLAADSPGLGAADGGADPGLRTGRPR